MNTNPGQLPTYKSLLPVQRNRTTSSYAGKEVSLIG